MQSYTCNLVSCVILFCKLQILVLNFGYRVSKAHCHFSLLQRSVDGWLENGSVVCKDKKNYSV